MQDFSLSIRLWFRQNSRTLPWRETKDPYLIWLSEIILQQTRVDQGRAYYEKFVKHYPKVQDLASASQENVLNDWQGLGYYSRARNLHYAAQQIVEEFDGFFPQTYKEIKSLKGVGDYTAAAIASFAFDLPYAVVDGNVYRVLSRYFADATPIDSTAGKKLFAAYAKELLSQEDPGEHNQAMMELGALVCKPKNPDCDNCPVQDSCEAYRKNEMLDYPVKSKKTKVRDRYFNYLVSGNTQFQFEKREGKGIWQNMYQFPLFETKVEKSMNDLNGDLQQEFGVSAVDRIASYTHILSHQKIHAIFWKVDKVISDNDRLLHVDIERVDEYPLPRLIHRFFEEHNPEYGGN
tara:strand:+ start:10413 stop:11456 length:1044 start_codon:yes stop_codon:yes gene_type:complete